jgi:putative transposase
MARTRKQKPEEGMLLVEHVDAGLDKELTEPQSCGDRNTIEQRHNRPRKGSGGQELRWSQRVKALEQENARLKRLVAELSLQKLALRDILVSRDL